MNPYRIIVSIIIFLTFFPVYASEKPKKLIILSSKTNEPIEGAVIYNKEILKAYRSDNKGRVTLEDPYQKLQVKAKYHHPILIDSKQSLSSIIVMQHDENLLKKEQTLVFLTENKQWGTYGEYRENNDLLSYDLSIKVIPSDKYISGNNKIRFKMLKDGNKIQIDLFKNLQIKKILHNGVPLDYKRDLNAVYILFPHVLPEGSVQEIDFHYAGNPVVKGRFGCFTFQKDSLGKDWINTACQGDGSMIWWPNKDQQPDEVEQMTMRVSVPSDLKDISNGRLIETNILNNGFTEYVWQINNPINNYSVSLNIGNYVHFGEMLGKLTMDYYVLEQDLEKAKEQFSQAKPMMVTFQKYFGEYPFIEDGYKLIQAPYAGMEHQSAVTYGNGFKNGYKGKDWTGVGISPKFDFIIIHESGHEWFGNSLTSNDFSDAWIHEGWCTYAESVYVEDQFGYKDAIKYINGYKAKVDNLYPLTGPSSIAYWPTSDNYFKGALFINTLRHIINDDDKWWKGVKAYTTTFNKKNFYTVDVLNFFNRYFDYDFEKIFDQYLYFNNIPSLQLSSNSNQVNYRWQSQVTGFDMPIDLFIDGKKVRITPKKNWQSITFKHDFEVADDLFYINIERKSD